ncbi:MAG: dethiobiotin synthase [Legionella sp.]|nr:dethiobiotin synthase [Legionella sp.]
MQRYFIIGTDTDCGKTYVTCELLKQSKKTIAIKPIESGGTFDADLLAKHQPHYTKPLSRYNFEPAISPHLAAAEANQTITFDALDTFCDAPEFEAYQTLLIETTGGIMCPLNHTQTWLDYLAYKKASVIFVVGIRLGCLNHALLTAHALKTHQISCAGWIANICDPNMSHIADNIETLKLKLPYPKLATVTFETAFDTSSSSTLASVVA